MTTSREVARSYCSLFGLSSVVEGTCPEGTELIVLNRLDTLALVGTIALLPNVEALVDIRGCDVSPQTMVELGIWGCMISDAGQMLDILNFRLACGRSMLIDQGMWELIRDRYDWRAPVVFGSAALEDTTTMRVRFAEPDSKRALL